METDFVSEVDRKFFANNLLSNEDYEASMDLTDMMALESPDFFSDLQLPDTTDVPSFFDPSLTHDDLLNDWSDSSDSGVSGLLNAQSPDAVVKSEPMSPASPALSHHSDSCDSAISQLTDGHYTYIITESPIAVDDTVQSHDSLCSSDLDVTFQSSQNARPVNITSHPMTSLPASPATIDLATSTIKHEFPSQQPSPLNIVTNSIPATASSDAHVHIDSILSSKIKIQPKPDSNVDAPSPKKPRTISTDSNSSQKSLVLTPDEFQRLTSQGLLRFQPPKQESILKPCTQPVLPTTASTVVTAACPPQIIPVNTSTNGYVNLIEDKDAKAFKRQQRMIKNRESASLSRKRKKEYMSTLEERLKEFCDENDRLKMENLSLKRKVSELHTENESLKKTFTITPALKKTVLLSFFVFFMLNFGTWSSVMLTTKADTRDKLALPTIHRGRQLMSVPDSKDRPRPGWSPDSDTVNKLHDLILEYGEPITRDRKHNLTDVPPMCPTYFNKTESMRLAEQLAGWMYRHEEEKQKVGKKQSKRGKNKQLRPISTLRRAMRGDMHHPALERKYERQLDSRYQIQVYEGANTGKDFLKALHRRNDTFYVLSFDEDYYLVPAIQHNKTSRPRMSLVMPAVALNESMMPSDDLVGMMQIDCEVMNTQLIHVRKSAIPRHVREKHNTTYPKFDKDENFYP